MHSPEKISEIRKELDSKNIAPELRFATDIIRISDERRPLYRTVKVSPNLAEAKYLFEQLFVDKTVVSADEAGNEKTTVVSEKAHLDFDEFVAHLWNRGVRYGLLENEIRAFLSSDPAKNGWETVARQLDPSQGTDASTKEVSDRLHQDKAPQILEGGRVDLRHFRNRFPQVTDGERLMEKLPRALGTPGMSVSGAVIEPAIPKDFDLASVAGPGTRIETDNGRTFLTAAMNGYVDIDTKSNTISISEKIIHREGANMRQTGSLDLEGDHFEEHGDVDNSIEVSGHSIHIRGNVYGTVNSKSGSVVVEGNLMNGKIFAKGHSVTLNGKVASNSRIEAPDAEVTLEYAENCVIIGKKVTIKRARNCTILAEDAEVGESEGSSIGTKRAHVLVSKASSNGDDTVITLEIPDIEELSKPLQDVIDMLKERETGLTANRQKRLIFAKRLSELKEDPLVKKFVEQNKKVKEFQAKGGTLTPEQAKGFQDMKIAIAPKITMINNAAVLIKQLDESISMGETEIAPLLDLKQDIENEIEAAITGISAIVESVLGETVVRTRTYSKDVPRLGAYANPVELKKEASALGRLDERKFSGSSGSFSWTYEPRKRA